MNILSNIDACTGCRLCEQICPKKAITIVRDECESKYPSIDMDKCIDCGICHEKCPLTNKPAIQNIIKVYAVQSRDEKELMASSSGGIFSLLAHYILDQGGVVFGCKLDENFNAVITSTTNESGLNAMRGSKYVESDTCDTYKEVQDVLNDGKKVLYSGTPCQVAGLLKYVKNDSELLYTVDFLCGGFPVPKALKAYIEYENIRHNDIVETISFRDKSRYGVGPNISLKFRDKWYKYSGVLNPYFYGYCKKYWHRKSCYQCQFKTENRYSDMTIGDYWGVGRSKQYRRRDGVSFAFLNNKKAIATFQQIMHLVHAGEATFVDVAKHNNAVTRADSVSDMPSDRHDVLRLISVNDFKSVNTRYLKLYRRIVTYIRTLLPYKLKDSIKKYVKK